MNERLIILPVKAVNPVEGAALAALDQYTTVPCNLTIVYVCASADTDDTGLTVDINDDGTGVITAIDAADKEAPGTWTSTHFGGAETPVNVAAGSVLSFDFNNAAVETTVEVHVWCLLGEVNA